MTHSAEKDAPHGRGAETLAEVSPEVRRRYGLTAEKDAPWWVCPLCGFDAKRFERSPEHQPGAIRYHMALHEAGSVIPPEKGES